MHDSTPVIRSNSAVVSPPIEIKLRPLLIATISLVVLFSIPLYELIRFSLQSELFSHILLVPLVSLYLVWMKRSTLPPHTAPDPRWAILPFILGGALVILRFTANHSATDSLALTTSAFILFLIGLCALYISPTYLRQLSFPLGFLIFMVPFPDALTGWIETELQHASAEAAYVFFKLSGTTVFRQENYFELPGMKLFVAPECSGIHSSLALFITSLLAGYMFLRSPVKRGILALAVIPLAIIRNGVRVFVIGELCVHIGPEMINSYIHHHGGPIFFALSLIPFFGILWLLYASEKSRPAPPSANK